MGSFISKQKIHIVNEDNKPIVDLKFKSLDILNVCSNIETSNKRADILNQMGHKVTSVSDGKKAIQNIKEKWINDYVSYHVIIVDLNFQSKIFADDVYYVNMIRNEFENKLISRNLPLPEQFIIAILNHSKWDNIENLYDDILHDSFTKCDFNLALKKFKNVQDLIAPKRHPIFKGFYLR
jgi:hypothetical protein